MLAYHGSLGGDAGEAVSTCVSNGETMDLVVSSNLLFLLLCIIITPISSAMKHTEQARKIPCSVELVFAAEMNKKCYNNLTSVGEYIRENHPQNLLLEL